MNPPPSPALRPLALSLMLAMSVVAPGAGLARRQEPTAVLDGIRCAAGVTLPCDTVRHHLGLAAGVELSAATLDRALRRLWATGLVDDVELTLEPAAAGRARLVVSASERPLLDEIRFAGVDRLTRARVEDWLAGRRSAPVPGRRVDRPALERLRGDLADLLAAEGRASDVTYRLLPVGPGRVEAVFSCARRPPGPLLSAIVFDGASAVEPGALRRVMRRNRVASAGARIAGRGRLDAPGLDSDRRAIERAYLERGFKDVVIGPIEVRRSADGASAELFVPVREGRAWRLGALSIRGNRTLGDQRLLALFERRDESFSRPAVEGWLAAIARLYAELGRLDTRIDHQEAERPGGRVDVVVTIEEGAELRLGRLTVSGNGRTAETVLRRELEVDEGLPLDLTALERGLARLRARGLFEPASEPWRLHRRGADSDRVDLTLSGRDADPYRVDFGGGWSNADGLSGHLALEARNLLGRGVAAGLRATQGDVRDRLELFVLDPLFLHRRQTASAEVFDRGRRLGPGPDEIQERQERGWRLGWSRPLGRRQRLRLDFTRARLEDRRASGAGTPAAAPAVFDRSSLAAGWTFDSRDDPLLPSRGLRAHLSLTASSDHGVGGREVVEPRAGVALFRPLGATAVLAARVDAGTVEVSGAAASPLDAVFLGGPGSVRGFPTGSIVARDDGGVPVLDAAGFRRGGDRFLVAGLEARFPLARALAGAIFIDAGQVWTAEQSPDLDGARLATGIEIWLQPRWLPVPLRLTWAHNLDPLPDEEFDRFLVGFGAAF